MYKSVEVGNGKRVGDSTQQRLASKCYLHNSCDPQAATMPPGKTSPHFPRWPQTGLQLLPQDNANSSSARAGSPKHVDKKCIMNKHYLKRLCNGMNFSVAKTVENLFKNA